MVAKTGVTPHSASTDDELHGLSDVLSPGLWAWESLNYHPLISILMIPMIISTIKPNVESMGTYGDDDLRRAEWCLPRLLAHGLIITATSNGHPPF